MPQSRRNGGFPFILSAHSGKKAPATTPKKTVAILQQQINFYAFIIMGAKQTDYLNLKALLDAEKNGYLAEQLSLQRSKRGQSGLTTESYVVELLHMHKDNEKRQKIRLSDVRKTFHGDY